MTVASFFQFLGNIVVTIACLISFIFFLSACSLLWEYLNTCLELDADFQAVCLIATLLAVSVVVIVLGQIIRILLLRFSVIIRFLETSKAL
jgi:hypothetical protein